MVLVPPSLPTPRFPPSSLSSANLPACVSLSPPLSSSPSVCLYPSSARMTDSVAAIFSPSVPTFSGLPPRPVRLVVLGSGVGGVGRRWRPPAMALSSVTCRQASSGVWVFLGLWTRKACPNTAVCARTAPLLYPVPPSDSGLSRPSIWVPSLFTPNNPFVALGPSWVFVVPVSLLPPPP